MRNERLTPGTHRPGVARAWPGAPARRGHAPRRSPAAPAFCPLLGVLTAFWIYVALSNVMYANNMQASLSSQKIEHVFAPWDARAGAAPAAVSAVHPVHVGLAAHRLAARCGARVPMQLLCALGFAVLASPALVIGRASLTEPLARTCRRNSTAGYGLRKFMTGAEMPTWLASITSFLVTYGFGLALITGFAFYQRLRDSQLRSAALERALTQAHLAALRMQLSPHTLFNLLHTIRGQITWDPPAAQAMVVQLGDLLRRLLSAGEREFSRLADELQFVALYLELQQKRFADRLTHRGAAARGRGARLGAEPHPAAAGGERRGARTGRPRGRR